MEKSVTVDAHRAEMALQHVVWTLEKGGKNTNPLAEAHAVIALQHLRLALAALRAGEEGET